MHRSVFFRIKYTFYEKVKGFTDETPFIYLKKIIKDYNSLLRLRTFKRSLYI